MTHRLKTKPSRPAGFTRRAGTPGGGSPLAKPTVDEAVGRTPLVALRTLVSADSASVLVKLEGLNPSGSVKARPALFIVRDAERRRLLDAGHTLLDASSGNTAIAYAMLCAARGYACEICLPANASAERKRLLEAYGARIVETDAAEGSDGAVEEARKRAREDPDRYFHANQYGNPANVRAHLETTAPEIWRQTDGRVTHFVAALGTSGTFVGTGRGLRERRPDIRLVAVQPDAAFHGLEGVKHMETAIRPDIYDPELADEILQVGTEESQEMARRLAREEGLSSGVSGGANVVAALRVAARAEPGAQVVTMLPDGAERYLSEEWMR